MGRGSENSLSPGFRFHPTDEELVRFYLRRKISARPFRFDPINVVDIYKSEPWDLPDKSKLKSRDLEWYFFSALDKKYGNGSKTNRATEKGYWKTTGKDRAVHHKARTVGMKKTLVYHLGRAPRGERTNWVMHEYRMTDEELGKSGVVQDAFVLCRIFQKSGSGPKNGEQYGAPFVEEEWEDDEVVVADDAFIELNDIDEKFEIRSPPGDASIPLNLYYGDTSNYVEHSLDGFENDSKPICGIVDNQCASVLLGDQKLIDLPEQDKTDVKPVKDEFIGESSSNDDSLDLSFLLDDPLFDATDNPLLDDELFLETNDLLNPVEADPIGIDMLDEYLTFFDADGDNSEYLIYDPSQAMGGENSVSNVEPLAHKHVNGATGQVSIRSPHKFEAHGYNDASSSKKNLEDSKFESGFSYPFTKYASRMLGDIPAPPAFASEFPAKDLALRLNQAAHSSNSINITTGMIGLRNMTLSGNRVDWSFGKNGNVNVILSFGLSQGDAVSANSVPISSTVSGKTGPTILRGWFYLMFLWALIIVTTSFKIGSCICSR